LFTVTVNHDWQNGIGDQKLQVERLRTILEVLNAMPLIQHASPALDPPFTNAAPSSEFWKRHGLAGRQFAVGPGIFQTIQAPLRAGREFSPTEIGDVPLAMLNESAARALWPGEPLSAALGRNVRTAVGDRTVIGVVRDIRSRPSAPSTPDLFLPIGTSEIEPLQTGLPVIIRMAPGAIPDAGLLTARLNERFPPNGVRVVSIADQMAPVMDRPRFLAVLFGAVAIVAVLLVTAGVYGVTSVECTRRRREMAIRLALGASPLRVRRHVLVQVIVPVLAGAAVGLLGARTAIQTLQISIREFSAPHLVVYVSGALAIVGAAWAAVWWSSRGVAYADPAEVLRSPAS
jgi:hypothetical protein